MKPLLLIAFLALGACAAPQPQFGAHLNTTTGHVSPSVATNLGPVRLGATRGGGVIGTRIAGIGLSAGF